MVCMQRAVVPERISRLCQREASIEFLNNLRRWDRCKRPVTHSTCMHAVLTLTSRPTAKKWAKAPRPRLLLVHTPCEIR